MSIAKIVSLATFALAASMSVGCGGGVEGTYKLDKAEAKKAMEVEIAKMPADQQGFAKIGLALIDAMEMSVEIMPGGKLKTKSSMPNLLDKDKPAKVEEKEGTWKMEGETVVLETDGKPAKCAKSGSKLTCTGEKKGEPTLVFVKG